MNKKLIIVLGVLGFLAFAGLIVVLSIAGSYNALVRDSQAVDAQWAQVQNVYQRRMDLIPNLVQTVQGAANFEKSTLTAVVEARASATQVKIDAGAAPTDPQKLAEFERAQGQLGGALSRLLVTVERYPELRATANFGGLQAELAGTENRISVERGRFNDAVLKYNTRVKSFPTVFYAGMFGYSPKPFFTATAGAEKPPEVKFDFDKKPAAAPPAPGPTPTPAPTPAPQ